MDPNSPEMLRAMRAYQKQDYEKQMVAERGAGSSAFEMCGPPNWSQPAWDAFRAQYGFWPYSAAELPPTFEGAPDWVYERMGLRKPPITATMRPGMV